jgi:beta-ureidopropionase / N-carbamoyl-L-amino-acid hydrolase
MRRDFDVLAGIGATVDGGVSRIALSAADLQARAWLADVIEQEGFTFCDDDAGNLSGVLPCAIPDAPTVLIGSHLDSVPNGGLFDGTIGIVAGLECLRIVRDAGLQLPAALELINFTDDEGAWKSLFGARALVGAVDTAELSDTEFVAALRQVGLDPRTVTHAKRDPRTLKAYLELHIEHGTRLERGDIAIGTVNGIVGRATYEITFYGQAGHSGTTDMYQRRDALRGASAFIVRAHEMIRERFGDGIFNCGDLVVKPGKFNIIPSEVRVTVEVRHVNHDLMAQMESRVFAIARECAASHNLQYHINKVTQMPSADMSEAIMQAIEQACADLTLTSLRMVSYAGHAAQFTSQIVPSGMIFVPSVGGYGHQPSEYTPWGDIVDGANVLLHTVLKVALHN